MRNWTSWQGRGTMGVSEPSFKFRCADRAPMSAHLNLKLEARVGSCQCDISQPNISHHATWVPAIMIYRSETQGTRLGSRHGRCTNIHSSKPEPGIPKEVLPVPSLRILSFTDSPDSIPTVLVITRLTRSQTGPLHPATVGFPAAC
jgi:hypothetical protein